MKTFFTKATFPRQLRKKRFLRGDSNLASFSQVSLLPVLGRPVPAKMAGRVWLSWVSDPSLGPVSAEQKGGGKE